MEEEVKQKHVVASWSLELWVDCPHCDNYFDVLAPDVHADIHECLPNICETLEGVDIEDVCCPECHKEFTINDVQY